MNKSRLELKVGFFVGLCLVILAVLMLQFSKGTTFFRKVYTIALKSSNVGGLHPKAAVLMSGVQVGTISQILLAPDGRSVTIYLKIYANYEIHEDARFAIEQSGILGDQYVAIYPEANKGALLGTPNHMTATAEEPFNIQEVARSARGFILRIDETAKKLNDAIADVRNTVLNERTLTNIVGTVESLHQFTQDARTTVQNINQLVISNRVPVEMAVSNAVVFSERLNTTALSAQDIIKTNSPQISAALRNIEAATVTLTNLLEEVQQGKGLASTVIHNEELAGNLSNVASNLSVASQILSDQGLWRLIRGPKHVATNTAATVPAHPHIQGRDPFN